MKSAFTKVPSQEPTRSSRRHRLIDTLARLLSDAFRLRSEGAPLSAQLRAQEHADEYIRRLEESGFTQRELLELVTQVRAGTWGPATRRLENDEDSDARVLVA